MSYRDVPNFVVRHLPWFICGYFALHIVIRVLLSPVLGKDEGEQVLLTQALAWGYGSQPPLYTWLASGFFAVFGEGVFALTLLKNILLAGTFLLTYASARIVTGDRLVAAVAAATLFLVPQISWESQRALTHTVLVIFTVALLTFALLLVQRRGRMEHYALFGLALAAGTLSKFNFLPIAAAKLLAAFILPWSRPRMINPRILLTAGIAAVLLWQPVQWIFDNRDATLYRAQKFSMAANDSMLVNFGTGLWSIVYAILQVVALPAVVYAIVLFRRSPGRVPDNGEKTFVRSLMTATAIAIAICAVMVLVFEVTKVKERWIHPLLYGISIAAALWSSWHLPARRLKAVLAVAAVCVAAVLVMLPARTLLGPAVGQPNPLNEPFADLATELRAAGFKGGGIMASYNTLGGNLRLQFPDTPVITPEYANFPMPEKGPYLLVWKAKTKGTVPPDLIALYKKITGRDLPRLPTQYVSSRMYYASEEMLRLGFVIAD